MRNYTGVGSNAKHGTMVGDRNVSLDTDSLARRYFWVDWGPGSVGGHFAFSWLFSLAWASARSWAFLIRKKTSEQPISESIGGRGRRAGGS